MLITRLFVARTSHPCTGTVRPRIKRVKYGWEFPTPQEAVEGSTVSRSLGSAVARVLCRNHPQAQVGRDGLSDLIVPKGEGILTQMMAGYEQESLKRTQTNGFESAFPMVTSAAGGQGFFNAANSKGRDSSTSRPITSTGCISPDIPEPCTSDAEVGPKQSLLARQCLEVQEMFQSNMTTEGTRERIRRMKQQESQQFSLLHPESSDAPTPRKLRFCQSAPVF